MTQDELLALRKRIIDDVVPLAVDNVGDSPDRFELLLRLIQAGNTSSAVYQKAYDAAKTIEDKDDKLNALMALVDEIDFELQAEDAPAPSESEPDTQPTDPAQSQH